MCTRFAFCAVLLWYVSNPKLDKHIRYSKSNKHSVNDFAFNQNLQTKTNQENVTFQRFYRHKTYTYFNHLLRSTLMAYILKQYVLFCLSKNGHKRMSLSIPYLLLFLVMAPNRDVTMVTQSGKQIKNKGVLRRVAVCTVFRVGQHNFLFPNAIKSTL